MTPPPPPAGTMMRASTTRRPVVRWPMLAVLSSLLLLLPPTARALTTSSPNGADPPGFKQLKIAFCSGNAMKLQEVTHILAEHGATQGLTPDTSLVALRHIAVDLPEIQEVDTVAIAKEKAVLAAQLAGGPCVVEDTSLQFHALGGMPGPYIKWFQSSLKAQGLYNILAAYNDKSATAVCTLAFCPAPHADPVLFTGACHGMIVPPAAGAADHEGWDSIFVPITNDGNKLPFSAMTLAEKCRVSHRARAVRAWATWLGHNQHELWERQRGKSMPGHKGLNFQAAFSEQ